MGTRQWIGSLVLIAGCGGLGWFAANDTAPAIETALEQRAVAVAQTSPHLLTATVSGRDVTVLGLATDEAEVAALQQQFTAISGVRMADLTQVTTLPVADPFIMQVIRDPDGVLRADGVLPSEDVRARFETAQGNPFADIPLASGMPTPDWPSVLQAGLDGLSALGAGDLTLSDQTLTLRGTLDTPQDMRAVSDAIGTLPDGYVLETQFDVLDDGQPFALNATLRDGGVEVRAKFPSDLDPSDVTDRFPTAQTTDITQSQITAPHPGWPDAARAGMDALGVLIEGDLALNATTFTLTGVGSPDGIAAAEIQLGDLPDTYDVTTALTVYGADFPLRLSMEWDGTASTSTGTYPADFRLRGPQGTAPSDVGETLFLSDPDGAFTANANAGVAALGLLNAGTLIATENRITLTGTATSPQVGTTIDAVLANAAPDAAIETVLNYLDDGSPAAWILRYDAVQGGMVEGRLPTGLTLPDIAAAIALPEVSGTPVTALEDDRIGNALDALTTVAPYLAEVETLTLTVQQDTAALDLILSPGVDLDLVAIDLAERLAPDVAFSLGPLDPLPAEGAERINLASGQSQVFQGGFWLPDLDFTPDAAGCTQETARVLGATTIGFLSGSDRLDAASIRAINALSAVARACIAAGLTMDIAGHTDNTGDATDNDILSQDRANAVRDALRARGVPAQAITTVGFGASQPIADNDTEDGRAANRRTDITWFAPGALRDP